MPRPYPAEFRAHASALVRAGKSQKQTADDLGVPSSESTELCTACPQIRELETELAIVRQAAARLGEDKPRPKGCTR